MYQMKTLEEISTGFFPVSVTEDDPFLVSNSVMSDYLAKAKNSGTKMTVRDGVMASKTEYLPLNQMLEAAKEIIPQNQINLSRDELESLYGEKFREECKKRLSEKRQLNSVKGDFVKQS